MKLELFPLHTCVVFELHAENDTEKALLNHLGYGHEAAAFDSGYPPTEGKLRIVIKNPHPPPDPPRPRRRRNLKSKTRNRK